MIQNIICERERFGERGFFIRETEQVLVWNNDQRVHNLLKGFDTLFRLLHALAALKLERLSDNTNSQNTKLTRGLRDNWSRASACTAAHTSRDKAHMRTSEMINDLLNAFFGSGSANSCTRTCAKTFGDFHTQLNAAL